MKLKSFCGIRGRKNITGIVAALKREKKNKFQFYSSQEFYFFAALRGNIIISGVLLLEGNSRKQWFCNVVFLVTHRAYLCTSPGSIFAAYVMQTVDERNCANFNVSTSEVWTHAMAVPQRKYLLALERNEISPYLFTNLIIWKFLQKKRTSQFDMSLKSYGAKRCLVFSPEISKSVS